MAGGGAAYSVAKWDGSRWSAMGYGIGSYYGYPSVYALAVSGSNVYAGGYFAPIYIAKWDGRSWTSLGSGMAGGYNADVTTVRALTVSGDDLYVGGNFTKAGDKVSTFAARAYLLPLPTLSVLGSNANVMVSWPSPDTDDFVLEQAGSVPPATWVVTAASFNNDGTNKWVHLPATNGAQFFRLRRP